MQSQQRNQNQGGGLQQYGGAGGLVDPFAILRNEMDQLFARVGGALGIPQILGTSQLLSGGGTSSALGQWGGSGIQQQQAIYLPVEVVETQNNYQITAEVPGLTEQNINITVSGNTLTIQGQKYQANEFISPLGQQGQQQGQQGQSGQQQGQQGQQLQGQQQGQQVYQAERSYGQFRRTFQLSQDCDIEKITANCTNGILTVLIPKTAQSQQQQRRIQVQSSSQGQQGQQNTGNR